MLDILPVPFLFFPLCSFTGDCSGDFNAINGIQIRQQVDDNKEMPYLIESKQSNTKSSRSTSFWFGLRKRAGRTVQMIGIATLDTIPPERDRIFVHQFTSVARRIKVVKRSKLASQRTNSEYTRSDRMPTIH